MNFLRNHWYDIGFILAIIVGVYLFNLNTNTLSLLLWINLIFLWLHQFEEYRYPGYFPGMINTVMFSSKQPDRFPLNSNTSLIINVIIGWLFYFLAGVFAEEALWLGIATILVSGGNFVVHNFVFNIKGKTIYNPGMLTSLFLFLPISIYFFYYIITNNLVTPTDWILGIILGIILNYVGIIKLIDWLKNENTNYIFPVRCLIPENHNILKQ